ncbi:MAG: PilW family protein [Acutalibacteraceae bacterium]
MKKLRSRKGFTLVELVVTVAILTIVLGMGTGAFVMVLQNYGTASSTEQEQEKASQLEDYIIRSARTAKDVKFLDSGSGATIPSDEGDYIFSKGGSSVVESYDYNIPEGETSLKKSPSMTVSGVRKLTVSLKRQKTNPSDATSEKKFLFLEYKIEMLNGYTVESSIVMNNLNDTYPVATGSMVDNIESFVVCEYNETSGVSVSDKAILFV